MSALSLGTLCLGTATSFAVLDRYAEAGGTFVDTAGNYAFWAGVQGGGVRNCWAGGGAAAASATRS